MARHYRTTDLDVTTIATLLGCKANSGLTNTINTLAQEGKIEDGDTYGWILKQVLEHGLARLGEVTRKPVEVAA